MPITNPFVANPPPAGDAVVTPTPQAGDPSTFAQLIKDGPGTNFLADDGVYKSLGDVDGVTGPGTSVDNEMVRFSGTTGDVIQKTAGATIDSIASDSILSLNRGLQSLSYNCSTVGGCYISSRPVDQTEANPNIITINSVNFGSDNGGFISINSRIATFPNWIQTSASAITTAQFIRLAADKFELRWGNATNADGAAPGIPSLSSTPSVVKTEAGWAKNVGSGNIISTPYTVLETDHSLSIKVDGAPAIVNLPAVGGLEVGQEYIITDVSGECYGAAAITINPSGADDINGVNVPYIIDTPYQSVALLRGPGGIGWTLTNRLRSNNGYNTIRKTITSPDTFLLDVVDMGINLQLHFETTSVAAFFLDSITLFSSDTNFKAWYSGRTIDGGGSNSFLSAVSTGVPVAATEHLTFSNSVTGTLGTVVPYVGINYIGVNATSRLNAGGHSIVFDHLDIELTSGPRSGSRICFNNLRLHVTDTLVYVTYEWRGTQ